MLCVVVQRQAGGTGLSGQSGFLLRRERECQCHQVKSLPPSEVEISSILPLCCKNDDYATEDTKEYSKSCECPDYKPKYEAQAHKVQKVA
jgi:hypothetical protein